MTTEMYPHVEIAEDGVPTITGTQTKVVEVVLDRLAHNWDADEIQRQHPHLDLAQIYAALTYYHDHQDELDRDIVSRIAKVEEIAVSQTDSIVRAKLQTLGKLR
jgi:uncharacterized protein (DUF433 family)